MRFGIAIMLGWAAGAFAAAPALKIDTAVYDVNAGVLQFAFSFTNPLDSVLYLDCQLPPRAELAGGVLTLTFARSATGGAQAGGRAKPDSGEAPVTTADDYPPQRIAGGQGYQGQRKLDRVLGDYHARPNFAKLKIRIDYYPERAEGEGPMFLAERAATVIAGPHAVLRKGKAPPPPKVIHRRMLPGP